jgi:hypothetical protein
MLSLKWRGLFVVLALAGCKGVMKPAVPASEFSLEAQNEITQTTIDGSNSQVAVRFTVSLPGNVPPADLAKIESMAVLWPDDNTRTPILGAFEAEGDSLRATQLLSDRPDGLSKGSYMLEVTFVDGQTTTIQTLCDGTILSAPAITVLNVDSTSVNMQWYAPPVYHMWEIYLERTQPAPTTVVVPPTTGTADGGSMQVGFNYAFQPDEAYDLVMELENTCNHRVIDLPIP